MKSIDWNQLTNDLNRAMNKNERGKKLALAIDCLNKAAELMETGKKYASAAKVTALIVKIGK